MSSFNDRNTQPAERVTLAGIAAIIVVGVFVVCVILILAKSLFPSNESTVTDEVFTGTKATTSSVAAVDPKPDESAAPAEDTSSEEEGGKIIDESEASFDSSSAPTYSSEDSSSDTDSEEDPSSVELGEVAYLTQTAYLRSSGDENAEPLLSIAAGEEVTVIERSSNSEYVHVNYIGYDGYVWYGYLG